MTEEQMKKITLFQLTSDIFFGKVLEDQLACEEVINIITGKKFKIKNVKSQYSIRQLASHSVILDIIAVETKNARIHMEMHPQNNEDHMRRIRYNTACVDVECLEKSEDYQNLADVYGIYISKKNFGRKGKGINRIKRVFDSTEKEITDNIEQEASNGSYEYYVNLKGIGDTWEQTELIKYIANADGIIQHVAFPNLVKRVRFLKEEQEGVEIMCEILEYERELGEELGKELGKEIGETNSIKNLMESLEVSLNQAMNLLKIPKERQEKYKNLLSQ